MIQLIRNKMQSNTKLLQAILFAAGTPVRLKKLQNVVPNFEVALSELKDVLSQEGLALLEVNDELELITRPELAEALRSFFKVEAEELSPSLVEVLSLVAYLQPVTRSEIEKLRGVNSLYALKRLILIGLIERLDHPDKKGLFCYRVSGDFIKHLGFPRVESLPDYDLLRSKLKGQSSEILMRGQSPVAAD